MIRPIQPVLARVLATAQSLGRPIDASILAFFRISLGGMVFWQLLRYFLHGKIAAIWVEPDFHFTYFGFSWVRPLPGMWMHWLCGGLAVVALAVAVGWRYRVASILLAIGVTYLFLLEKSEYLNHGYLVCLLAWLAALIPAHTCWSLDARRHRGPSAGTVPAWTLWLLRFQVGIVYFYGGLAKLNGDWLRGEPMRLWLVDHPDHSFFSPWLQSEAAPWLFSYGGLLFDLLVVPALLWRRTRLVAFAFAVGFHVTNSQLFQIGIFPWLGILLTTLFFDPAWPRRAVGMVRGWFGATHGQTAPAHPGAPGRTHPVGPGILAFLCLYGTVQVLVPLRHFLYPGNVSWTEEGHLFAWHMKLRSKRVEAANFYVIDRRSGATWLLDPLAYLTSRQFLEMAGNPDMTRQFCAHVGELMRRRGHPEVEVRAVVYVRLNDHPPALLVDPKVDLAGVRTSLAPSRWILPLEPQLEARRQSPWPLANLSSAP